MAVQVERALDPALEEAAERWDERPGAVQFERVLQVVVERERARFGSWYEMFPRSAGHDATRSATFREAAERLPEIAAMGFDVLYLPPIHPIGTTHRKGPNNTLQANPGDPGSPWAIGSEAGGHMEIEPGLGTLEDFDRFLAAAEKVGLEIALDVAFQCSPDHPYVREHPEWFRHRPDGSIKYAENPPKKYQDIYPFDFECEAWESLWQELRDVVLFWAQRGVRIFRVDNPHTKTLGFWEWLIESVRTRFPDAVFLSEAFTRPKVMRHLAKRGFSQSYTYFTWRNTKQELTEYLTELTQTKVREYLRPNLFANTPDILHEYLQFGGRAAFQIRLVLAATLGASYGIYGPPFELCVGDAVSGTEEYQDSEKYQIRVWDRERPGNIQSFIRRVNQIRRDNPALQEDWSLRFHPVENEQLLFFSKCTPDRSNVVLVVVNLDPHHTQSGWVHLPLAALGLPEHESYQAHDLLSDGRFLWHGPSNFVSLEPHSSPAHIFRMRRKVKTERDFDYYL
jgi:starch synthase (maltosyl-transferring)